MPHITSIRFCGPEAVVRIPARSVLLLPLLPANAMTPASPVDPQRSALEQVAASAKGPYGDATMAPEDHTRLRYRLVAEADPQLPARVLAMLTVRNELPLQFAFTRRDEDESLELRFELQAHTVMYPELLLDRLLKIPTVREACLLPRAWEP